jgi:hypothetical protein
VCAFRAHVLVNEILLLVSMTLRDHHLHLQLLGLNHTVSSSCWACICQHP